MHNRMTINAEPNRELRVIVDHIVAVVTIHALSSPNRVGLPRYIAFS